MSNDNAPRRDRSSAPLGRWQRLRWRQRRDRNPAALDHEQDRLKHGHPRARGSHSARRQSAALDLRPWEQPHPGVGDALNSGSCARISQDSRSGTRETWDHGASHQESEKGHNDPDRPVVPACDRSGAGSSAGANPWSGWSPDRSRGNAQRACPVRTATSRSQRPIRRVASLARAVNGVVAIVCAATALVVVASALADSRPTIRIGISSQQAGPSRAVIRGRIEVDDEAGRETHAGPTSSGSRQVDISTVDSEDDSLPEPYPPLDPESRLARNPSPTGLGSFWYPAGPGRACIYSPQGVAPCYRLVGPGAPGGPALDPGAIAASLADRLPLLPGRITVSPESVGLTGAVSWFWLSPAPQTEVLTVTLAGERVSVRAEPSSVAWRFGDGVARFAGAGVPYRPGPPPAEAVVHEYGTRCLAGDRGRNPYVLPTCGSEGYLLEAVIGWRISFVAVGPVDASGSLPSRTTATSVLYPVSEARGFLIPGVAR